MALIVIGHHRSGTSILRRLCNSHPEVALTNEFGNFAHLNISYSEYARFTLNRWWKKRNSHLIPSELRSPGKRQVKGLNMLQNLVVVIRYLLGIYSHQNEYVDVSSIQASLKKIFPHVRIVGDKDPDLWFKLDHLASTAALECLLIYRDPRDLASSVVKKARAEWSQYWPEELGDVRTVANRWVRLINVMERNSDKIQVVRYEDLVTEPQPILQELGNWLDIDPCGFQHEMLNSSSVGKYQYSLSDQEVVDIIEIAGPTMRRVGYDI